MHTSVPIDGTVEIIDSTQVSPYLSYTKVKVCYVGQNPNRNDTVITKELATEMGRTLPGSPIVGLFNEQTKDFGGHDKQIAIKSGKFEMVDLTRPYGFVPTNAKVWFQKFNDEGVEHEYLCTECYIWTGAYPESQRIIDKGDNHSMELDDDKGFWTNDFNSGKRVFIYNEALIKKLCVLGENVEPCFEGAQFSNFSLNSPEFKEFKTKMYSMIQQIQESLDNKGGSQMDNENKAPQAEFKKNNPNEEEEKKDQNTSPDNKQEDSSKSENNKNQKQEEEKEKDKKKYNLNEVTEYIELQGKYADLQNQYAALQTEKAKLDSEITELRQFKLTADRQAKQSMIDSFYMLSDEDKKDVKDHIDTYSLDDIEAKLSIICVRNKVNFNLEQEPKKQQEEAAPQGLFNLNSALSGADDAPDWIKAVRATVNK